MTSMSVWFESDSERHSRWTGNEYIALVLQSVWEGGEHEAETEVDGAV